MFGNMNIIEQINQKRIEKKTKEFMNSGIMRYFHFDYGNMADGMTGYTLIEEDGSVHLTYQLYSMENGDNQLYEYYLPLNEMQRIKQLLREECIFLWNGFDKSNSIIATGDSFSLEGKFDRYHLKAYGMVMLPPGFNEKKKKLCNLLEKLISTYGENLE